MTKYFQNHHRFLTNTRCCELKILPIRSKTLNDHSIIQSINQSISLTNTSIIVHSISSPTGTDVTAVCVGT